MDNGVGVEAKIVLATIDTTAVESLGRGYRSMVSAILAKAVQSPRLARANTVSHTITLKRDTRDDNISGEDSEDRSYHAHQTPPMIAIDSDGCRSQRVGELRGRLAPYLLLSTPQTRRRGSNRASARPVRRRR